MFTSKRIRRHFNKLEQLPDRVVSALLGRGLKGSGP